MAARWRTLNSEAGILRKKQPENPEDLLVFGYSCKLFRDDEKALYIDQGKHLISWMGDDKLKIDRLGCCVCVVVVIKKKKKNCVDTMVGGHYQN